jgi:Cft2 family RNA processing exonuclease
MAALAPTRCSSSWATSTSSIDSGLHPKKVGRRAAPDHAPLRGKNLDLIIITHCHLDHIGSLPVTMREHPNAPSS